MSKKEYNEIKILEMLDFYHNIQSDSKKSSNVYNEVEYQLYSWGEIFPPFIGDREHSLVARSILPKFPFKLFSSSVPYNRLPQKLCLSFITPSSIKWDSETFHLSGFFSNEIARDFTAFLSLVTRRRVFVIKQTRSNGYPIEEEIDLYQSPTHIQERQRLKEIHPVEFYQLLENLRVMNRRIGNRFILANRLYHSAIEMMYSEPEFSYLFLVMSLEAISSAVYENQDVLPSDIENDWEEIVSLMNSKYPSWRTMVEITTSLDKQKLFNIFLQKEYFIFRKFSQFVFDNTPERFWSETEDDAKPNYLNIAITFGSDGQGKENISRSEITIHDWEKIQKSELKKVLREIYDFRSKLIHEGIRLPEFIKIGHFRKIPVDAAVELLSPVEKKIKIPPLLTLERLVSYSMVEFLRKANPMVSN